MEIEQLKVIWEVTKTYYETVPLYLTPPTVAGLTLHNMHGRIYKTIYQQTWDSHDTTYNYASHYNYDIEGNVSTLIQENRDLKSIGKNFKRFDYDYDLISGKVNEVFYQKDSTDQFIHKYDYDADNRIIDVQTTADGITWENEATYFYCKHGPLARVELGERQVQGVDYIYTLQGWIKGVNSSVVQKQHDMGLDSYKFGVGKHKYFGQDAYGYSLGYFENDYNRIADSTTIKEFELTYLDTPFTSASASL